MTGSHLLNLFPVSSQFERIAPFDLHIDAAVMPNAGKQAAALIPLLVIMNLIAASEGGLVTLLG